ncbi:hypothetical protein P8452_48702 [Trifolium repens]|nr:hypothetical protein P8452_48702 [Trifolium repens]
MLTNRGIEANLDKCQAIIDMRSPTSIKEVQQLTGRIAALSSFPRLASPPILTRPEKDNTLYLYLAVSDKALSSALVQEIKGEEKPIYFVSRTFKGAEAKYQKIEKLSLAVIVTARKLRQYFQSHKIMVKTDYPIKNVLRKPDLAGRMVAWSVELSEFDITFSPRGAIKSQILADFVLELTTPAEESTEQPWTLSVDGASNIRGSGAGIVLEGPDGVLIEQSLRFAFKASNNQAEYEALLAGMKLAKEMDITDLKAKSDSQLVTNQVSGEFQAKDPQLVKYLEKVRNLANHFKSFELVYVPREQNARADLLPKLASTKKPGSSRTFIQEAIANPSITEEAAMMVIEAEDWRSSIIRYLQKDELPVAKEEAHKLKRAAAWYSMLGDKLYKRGFSGPILLCVSQEEAKGILEEIHEGSCGSHIGARALAGKILRAGPFPASAGQAKWIIVAIDYFTKWIEAEALSNISADQVKKFYWRKIICRFGLPKYIVSDNGTQFASEKVVQFCKRKGEAPFTIVYGTDAMIPAEINPPSWRRDTLTLEENSGALEENLDLIQELRDKAHFREFVSKQRAARRYNTRVIARRFKEGDLVLKRPMGKDKGGKLAANWEGPFRINEAFEGGAYRLEIMEGEVLHRTWNVANLRFYYS